MIRPRPCSTRTDPLFPYSTLCRSVGARRRRQLVPLGDAVGRLLPTRELQVHRLALGPALGIQRRVFAALAVVFVGDADLQRLHAVRSEEHTSELQSLMRTSYAVFCLNIQTSNIHHHSITYST